MNISKRAIASFQLEYRVRALSQLRPQHQQVPNKPLGQNGFGLTDGEIWNMTRTIMVCVEARLQAPLMDIDLPDSYPSDKIISGELPGYDADVIKRLHAAVKAEPSYTLGD